MGPTIEERTQPLSRRFHRMIIGFGIVGVVLALVANSPIASGDHYWDAAREIGGAIVSGAAVAWLVVWFEEQREEQRVDREEARDDERFRIEEKRADIAAGRALRRDIDIRLSALINVDLVQSRTVDLEKLDDETNRETGDEWTLGVPVAPPPSYRSVSSICAEVEALLPYLVNDDLSASWTAWDRAYWDLVHTPEIGGAEYPDRTRHKDMHDERRPDESVAWRSFRSLFDQYIKSSYGSSTSP